MATEPAQLVRENQPISIELVSTIHVSGGVLVDTLQTPAQLWSWLKTHADRLPATVRGAETRDLARIRLLREAIREVFRSSVAGEVPERNTVAILNDASRLAPRHLELVWDRHRRQTASVTTVDAFDTLVATIAADAIAIVAGDQRHQLRACNGPSCVLYFVRTHPRQEWCSPACGNRGRVARHYERSKRSRSSGPGSGDPGEPDDRGTPARP